VVNVGITVITGPPAAGKTTLARQLAQHGDIVIDYDTLANALTIADPDNHDHPAVVAATARAARQAALDTALRHADTVDVYVIHTEPSEEQVARYHRLGATIRVVDPGRDVVVDRCRRLRTAAMLAVVDRWYRMSHKVVADSVLTQTSRSW
jgi:cytidylate kinase